MVTTWEKVTGSRATGYMGIRYSRNEDMLYIANGDGDYPYEMGWSEWKLAHPCPMTTPEWKAFEELMRTLGYEKLRRK